MPPGIGTILKCLARTYRGITGLGLLLIVPWLSPEAASPPLDGDGGPSEASSRGGGADWGCERDPRGATAARISGAAAGLIAGCIYHNRKAVVTGSQFVLAA